jgi:hypothetical protein
LYGKLKNDPAVGGAVGGRVYVDFAPQESLAPLVLFSFLGGSDKVLTRDRRLTNAIYLIRAVAQSSTYNSVKAISDRIQELVTVPTQGVYVDGVLITTAYREQPHQRVDLENGKPYVYLGGFYRIQYQLAEA